jgi:predicted GNAT family acetyltransferase
VEWFAALVKEAQGEAASAQGAGRRIDAFLDVVTNGVHLWEDGNPVSMAGHTGPTPNGIQINLVYTPPEHRRCGYASACVAALSQLQLDQGRKFCFLVAHLANPTSNHTYQTISYEAVGHQDEYRFS